MKLIADAGYDIVQTSPVQRCFVGDNGGRALFSQPGDSVMGKWYYYYQPTDWQIGNYMLGDRDQFKAMCDSAYKVRREGHCRRSAQPHRRRPHRRSPPVSTMPWADTTSSSTPTDSNDIKTTTTATSAPPAKWAVSRREYRKS